MRLVVTGASGTLGRQLVPLLLDHGCELLLVGRSASRLQSLFPGMKTANYDTLETEGAGFDGLVHLSVRNNDQAGSLAEFRAVNVDLLHAVAQSAVAAGIPRFVNLTTLHAVHAPTGSPYAQTKADGAKKLATVNGLEVINLVLPAVYGSHYTGKLAVLDKVPGVLRPLAFRMLTALKPTVHVSQVGEAILAVAEEGKAGDRIVTDQQMDNPAYAAIQRGIDIVIALALILIGWWIFIGAWIAVRTTSPGPAVFAQERVGKNARTFVCYKFRTMRQGTPNVGTHEVSVSTITRVGGFLRKTKIDELPQVWNVLRNDMSFVGPRPGLPVQTDLTRERSEHGVFRIKPGITGWAQIQNIDMSNPARLARVDAEYIALRTIPLDLKIMLATVTGKGQGDKIRQAGD